MERRTKRAPRRDKREKRKWDTNRERLGGLDGHLAFHAVRVEHVKDNHGDVAAERKAEVEKKRKAYRDVASHPNEVNPSSLVVSRYGNVSQSSRNNNKMKESDR